MVSSDELIKSLQELNPSTFSNESERASVKDALFAAFRRVQTPFDVAMDHTWTEAATTAAIKALIDADFWKKWVTAGGKPSDVGSLAATTGVDDILLSKSPSIAH